MIIINYSHPITDEQIAQIEQFTGSKVDEVRKIQVRLDHSRPFQEQIEELIAQAGLTDDEWQTLPIIINPPSLNFAAVMMLALLHGKMGYFPACLRLRPVEGSLPPKYEVAEVMNLQKARDTARMVRE